MTQRTTGSILYEQQIKLSVFIINYINTTLSPTEQSDTAILMRRENSSINEGSIHVNNIFVGNNS